MILNLNKNIYDDIKDDYLEKMKLKVLAKIESNKNLFSSNSSLDFFNETTIKELLIGDVIGNENIKWIEDYRKSTILANYKVEKGPMQEIFKHLSEKNSDIYNQSNRNKIYISFRKEIVKQYENPLIEELLLSNNKYFESFKEFEKLQKEIDVILKPYNDIGRIIFDYKLIGKESALRTKILSATQIIICPYCNRQFINTYDNNKSTIAQLDHFYPKNTFSLFTLNIYNFIPSCAHCNTVLKREKIFEHIYPLNNMGNNKQVFDVQIENYKQAIGWEAPKIRLKKSKGLSYEELYKNYILEKMHLESIYETHEDFVQLLINKSNYYNCHYKKGIENVIKRRMKVDFKYLLYGYNGTEKELLERPLSKLV